MNKFIDIGANLTDPVFRGIYRGKQVHANDFESVLQRAFRAGVDKLILTAGCLQDVEEASVLAGKHESLFYTVGCHPTRCGEFEQFSGGSERYFGELLKRVQSNVGGKIVAVGEFGLDYDRVEFCSVEKQKQYFEVQFDLAEESGLPLFLHNRNTGGDFVKILRKHRHRFQKGVVHSFTGSLDEAQEILDLGLFIGINGCSLKTRENLNVVSQIPLDRIMFETDAPWCDIRKTHASSQFVQPVNFGAGFVKKEKYEPGCMIRGRNEPCTIVQVAQVVCGLHSASLESVSRIVYETSLDFFWK